MDYSALYVYIKSIRRDDSEYIMDAVDSLKYNSEDFFSNMQTNLNLINYIDDDGTDISNIFCICGTKEKIDSIKEILLTEIISRLTLGSNFEEKYSDNVYSLNLLIQFNILSVKQ